MRDRYRTMFNSRRFHTDRNVVFDRTKITADVGDQQLILETYRRTHNTSLKFQHARGPLPGDRAVLPTYFLSFPINSGRLFRTAAPMLHSTVQSETLRDHKGMFMWSVRRSGPSCKYSDWRAFSFLYPGEEVHGPFYIGKYVSSNLVKDRSARSDSSAITEGFSRYYRRLQKVLQNASEVTRYYWLRKAFQREGFTLTIFYWNPEDYSSN